MRGFQNLELLRGLLTSGLFLISSIALAEESRPEFIKRISESSFQDDQRLFTAQRLALKIVAANQYGKAFEKTKSEFIAGRISAPNCYLFLLRTELEMKTLASELEKAQSESIQQNLSDRFDIEGARGNLEKDILSLASYKSEFSWNFIRSTKGNQSSNGDDLSENKSRNAMCSKVLLQRKQEFLRMRANYFGSIVSGDFVANQQAFDFMDSDRSTFSSLLRICGQEGGALKADMDASFNEIRIEKSRVRPVDFLKPACRMLTVREHSLAPTVCSAKSMNSSIAEAIHEALRK